MLLVGDDPNFTRCCLYRFYDPLESLSKSTRVVEFLVYVVEMVGASVEISG
jgi:hypothetical protein